MKVIDLLNKIANGEKVPEQVIYYNMLTEKNDIMYVCKENLFYKLDQLEIQLNSRVEGIEESKEHKIPEKIKDTNSDYYEKEAYYEKATKEALIKDILTLKHRINEILDYLEEIEKGE